MTNPINQRMPATMQTAMDFEHTFQPLDMSDLIRSIHEAEKQRSSFDFRDFADVLEEIQTPAGDSDIEMAQPDVEMTPGLPSSEIAQREILEQEALERRQPAHRALGEESDVTMGRSAMSAPQMLRQRIAFLDVQSPEQRATTLEMRDLSDRVEGLLKQKHEGTPVVRTPRVSISHTRIDIA